MGTIAALVVSASSPALAADTEAPVIVHEPCTQYQKGHAFVVRARFSDASALFEPKLIYRSGKGDWRGILFEREGENVYKAVVTARELRGRLEYFIELFDVFGNGPARYARPEAPVPVEPSSAARACQNVPDFAHAPAAATLPAAPATQLPAPAIGGEPGGAAVASARPGPLAAPSPAPATPGRACSSVFCSWGFLGGVGALLVGSAGLTAYLMLRPDTAPPGEVYLSLETDGVLQLLGGGAP